MNRWMWILAVAVCATGVALQVMVRLRDPQTDTQTDTIQRLAASETLPADWLNTMDSVRPPADDSTLEALRQFAQRFPDYEAGREVLRVLERLGGAEAVRLIYELGRQREDLSADATVRLARVRGREAAQAYLEILSDPSAPDEFVAAALRALGHTRLRQPLKRITAIASDEQRSVQVRVAASTALGLIADPAAVPVLGELLNSPAAPLRRQAIRALGSIRSPESLTLLEAVVESPKTDHEEALARDALAVQRGEARPR